MVLLFIFCANYKPNILKFFKQILWKKEEERKEKKKQIFSFKTSIGE